MGRLCAFSACLVHPAPALSTPVHPRPPPSTSVHLRPSPSTSVHTSPSKKNGAGVTCQHTGPKSVQKDPRAYIVPAASITFTQLVQIGNSDG